MRPPFPFNAETVQRIPRGVRAPIEQSLLFLAGIVMPETKDENKLDQLTGLLKLGNFKDEFYKRIQANQYPEKDFLVFFDGDGFGRVNKDHGHLTGNDVIRDFASRIQQGMRESDLIGRYGGDEFVALCMNISPDVLLRRLSELNGRLHEEYGGQLSFSIGAAPVTRASFRQTFELADRAQQLVKQNGGNGVAIYPTFLPEALAEVG